MVWTGPGADAAAGRLGEYGAQKVYAADSPDLNGYVTAPAAELLARLMAEHETAAVLVAPWVHRLLHRLDADAGEKKRR